MKYILVSLLFFFAFSLAPIHAQEVTPQASQQQGGVRPSNVFFFLDRLVEEIQAFLTFDPQARVRLRLEFAAERLAEVQLEIAAKNAQGLGTALTNLREQIASARTILASQQAQGADVSVLTSQAQLLIESQEEELEGLVEEEIKINGTLSILTDETITVVGITLLRSPITKIEIGVDVGSTVEVKATSQADGNLLARKVELSDEPEAEVKAKGILSTLTDNSAIVAGITLVLTPQTKREGTLAVGGEVEVKAIPQEDGSLVATKIEAEEEDNLKEELKVKIKLEVDKLDDEDDKLSSLLPPRQKESKLLRESVREAEKAARESVKELRKASTEASKTAEKATKEEEKATKKQAKEEAKSFKETAKEAERQAKEAEKAARETQKRSEEIRSKLEKSIKEEEQQKEEKRGNKEKEREESKQEEEESD